MGADDPQVLEWAAQHNRVLLTHDFKTMAGFAYERVSSGRRMPGVVEVCITATNAIAINDFVVLNRCSLKGELEGRVVFIPL